MEKNLDSIIGWDAVSWSVPLHYWQKIISKENRKLNCLELGSNRGGLSLWLALKGHSVICSDLKDTEETARPLHEKFGVTANIEYKNIDATNIPYENHFDIVIFKSVLGGIGRNNNKDIQHRVVMEIKKCLKPGGMFLFAENAPGTILHNFFRKKFTDWGSSWRYVSVQEMKEFLTGFSSFEVKTTGFSGVFGRGENQKRMLGRLDQLFFNAIIPNSWKYILYGSAKK